MEYVSKSTQKVHSSCRYHCAVDFGCICFCSEALHSYLVLSFDHIAVWVSFRPAKQRVSCALSANAKLPTASGLVSCRNPTMHYRVVHDKLHSTITEQSSNRGRRRPPKGLHFLKGTHTHTDIVEGEVKVTGTACPYSRRVHLICGNNGYVAWGIVLHQQ